MAKKTASERIVEALEQQTFSKAPSNWLPVHVIAGRLGDVSACSVSARLRELARKGLVTKRKVADRAYDEWALVKLRDPEDFI